MAAAYGVSGAHEYVFESVLEHLDTFDRKVLAVAAAIGGGDPDVLRAAVGRSESDPAEVLASLPLVTTSESGEFVVHDLWRRVLGEALESDDVVGAVARAVDALIEREDFDHAFELCIERRDWQAAADALGSCCRRGHAPVRLDVLTRWLEALPTERRDDPDGLLLRGLLRRVTNPFQAETATLLERAVAGYRAAGNVVGEVAAGVELVYVLRNQGRTETLPVFLARATELAAQGHSIATGPAAVGRALLAELSGDDRKMLALLEAIPDGSLSRDWASVVPFRQAIGHLTLGDEQGMLDAAQRCARLAGDAADRHVVALVEWFVGNPLPALQTAEAMDVDAGTRSQVNAVILGSVRTMVLASAGLVDEASRRLADTERAVSGSASALMLGALVGIRALLAAAQGDDDHAHGVLEESLQAAPLTDPIGWRMSARWLPLAYVLVPSTREHLDHRPTGVVHSRRLDVARAVVASLEGFATLPRAARSLAPASVATTVPLPWAMALAGRLTADGDVGGRALVEYLFALYGEPAREAVRAAVNHSDRAIVDGARRLLASITMAPRHSIRLGVLGPVTLHIGDGVPVNDHWNRDRVRSLLVYLVIHGPAQRDQILEALWPHLDPSAADRNLRVTLSYLHQVLEPDRRKGEAPFYVRQIGPTLSLADGPQLVVDLHEFESALDRARRRRPTWTSECCARTARTRAPPLAGPMSDGRGRRRLGATNLPTAHRSLRHRRRPRRRTPFRGRARHVGCPQCSTRPDGRSVVRAGVLPAGRGRTGAR